MAAGEIEATRSARSLLFVPGDRPEWFDKAASSGADEIVLDLEDAVQPEEKAAARKYVRRWRVHGGTGLVRVNGTGSPWYDEDVAALADRPCGVLLPKVTSPLQVAVLLRHLPAGSYVLPVLETAAGVLDARAVCSAHGVVRAVFGNGDLAADLGVDHADLTALQHTRSAVVLASVAVGIGPPLDGATTAVDDDGAVAADAEHAAALGFTGKVCIHPRQVPVVNAVFTPPAEQVRWARQVLATAGDGAARRVGGHLIDRPVVERARQLLARTRDVR